jgi:hypothetical protein
MLMMCENVSGIAAEAQSGIDLLITRGPTLDALVGAIERAAGVERIAIKLLHEPNEAYMRILNFPAWVVVNEYASGDFAFKIDLVGKAPRNYRSIAREIARDLDVTVCWPDERTLATTAWILCAPDGSERNVALGDTASDGFSIMD